MAEPQRARRVRRWMLLPLLLAALPLLLPERAGTDDAARARMEAWRGAPAAPAWTSPLAPRSRSAERWRFAGQAAVGAAVLGGVLVLTGRRRA